MILEKLALFCVVLFAFIGVIFTSIIVHEYTHYNDFKDLKPTDEKLCGLVLPTGNNVKNISNYLLSSAGYYSYTIETKNMTAAQLTNYDAMQRRTEVNAYTAGALIFVFFFICYLIITFARYKDKLKILNYKTALDDREEYIDELEKVLEDDKNIFIKADFTNT